MRELRAEAWEIKPDEYVGPGHPLWDQAVAEMEAEGFRPIWSWAYQHSTVAVAVFEKRAPTAEERLEAIQKASAALSKVLEGFGAACSEAIARLESAWAEAVERNAGEERAPSDEAAEGLAERMRADKAWMEGRRATWLRREGRDG